MNVVKIVFGTNSVPQKVISLFSSTLRAYTHPVVFRLLYDSLLHLTCPLVRACVQTFNYLSCSSYTSCVQPRSLYPYGNMGIG